MVEHANLGDLDQDVVARVIGFHGLGRCEGHSDNIGIGIESAGGLGEYGAALHHLGDEAVDKEEDNTREEVVPEHAVWEVDNSAQDEDDRHHAMDGHKHAVELATDLRDGSHAKDEEGTLGIVVLQKNECC